MGTYLMFGKYSEDGLREIGAKRTMDAVQLIEGLGGSVTAMYALLGVQDLVLIVEMPSPQAAAQASVAIGKATGIMFSTSPAIAVEDFDKLVTDL